MAALLAAMLDGTLPQTVSASITGIERVASGLSNPMFVTYAPGDPSRLFIGERTGTIRILNLTTGASNRPPFFPFPMSMRMVKEAYWE